MDWPAVAQGVADVLDRPVFGVDASGRLVLFNRALERLVGWRRDEALGRCWTASIIAPEPGEHDALGAILRGDVRIRLMLRSSRGVCSAVTARVWPVGPRDARVFIVAIEGSYRSTQAPPSPWGDDWMEVSTREDDRGAVVRASSATTQIGIRCWDAVAVRTSACEHCPVRVAQAPVPIERRTLMLDATDGRLMVVRTLRATTDTVIVWHEPLDGMTAADVARGRLNDLADHHQLSAREREVLEHLMLGASLDHIAQALGISARTVKFHQANLLDKLGLVSRFELSRMIVGELT